MLPLTAAIILIATGLDYRRSKNRFRFLPALTLTTTIFGLVAAHFLFGLKYPLERTALYVVPLFCIAWAIAAYAIRNRPLRGTLIVAMFLLALQFATQLQTRYFEVWKFDMATKTLAMKLKIATEGKPAQSTTVSSRWLHQPALEFYRDNLNITALKPVEWFDEAALSGFDYYVLQEPKPEDLERNRLRVLFSDRESGIVLAEGR